MNAENNAEVIHKAVGEEPNRVLYPIRLMTGLQMFRDFDYVKSQAYHFTLAFSKSMHNVGTKSRNIKTSLGFCHARDRILVLSKVENNLMFMNPLILSSEAYRRMVGYNPHFDSRDSLRERCRPRDSSLCSYSVLAALSYN